MTNCGFLGGIGMGMIAGAAAGMLLAPKDAKQMKRTANKMVRSMQEAVEHLTDAINN